MGGEEADLVMLTASRLPAAEPLGGLCPLRRARGVRARERQAGPAPQDRRAPRGHMIKSQLSDYARERLQARLKEMGFGRLEEVAPLFALDSPSDNARSEEADPLHWMRFVKMGIRMEIECNDGSLVTGTILSGAAAREFIEEHDIKRKDKRPCLVVRRTDDDYDIVPWAEVVDVKRTEG